MTARTAPHPRADAPVAEASPMQAGAGHTLVERLRMIRGTQFTPLENELVGEAADTITELLEALERAEDAIFALAGAEPVSHEWHPDHSLCRAWKAAAAARAAIAKARGAA